MHVGALNPLVSSLWPLTAIAVRGKTDDIVDGEQRYEKKMGNYIFNLTNSIPVSMIFLR